jgi:hypothetical protein
MASCFKPCADPRPTPSSSIFGRLIRQSAAVDPQRLLAARLTTLLAQATTFQAVTAQQVNDLIVACGTMRDRQTTALLEKLFRQHMRYVLADEDYSESEHRETVALKVALGLPGPVAQALAVDEARAMLRAAIDRCCADGIVTEAEHQHLSSLKKQLRVADVEVPPVGTDAGALLAQRIRALSALATALEVTAEPLQALLDRWDAGTGSTPNSRTKSILADALSDADEALGLIEDCIGELPNLPDLTPEELETLAADVAGAESAARQANAVLIAAEKRVVEKVETFHNEGDGDWDAYKARNAAMVQQYGFHPAGSPKQISWAYDIIAEQVLATDLLDRFQQATSTGDKLYLTWWKHLQRLPCGWWIGKARFMDLDDYRAEWMKRARKN